MPLLTALADDFTAPAIDATKWPNSFGTHTQAGGRARVTCDTGYSAYSSARIYTLTGAQASARIWPPANGGATAEAWIQAIVLSSTGGTDAGFEFDAADGTLTCMLRVGYSDGAGIVIPYDATAHAWVRLREAGGSLYWETSPDGIAWSVRRTATTPAWAADTNLEYQLIAHRDGGTVDYAEFDNVNMGNGPDEGVNVSAGEYDLTIEAGATFSETYTSANDNGTRVDWTGWTPRAQIRTGAGPSGGLLIDLTPYLAVSGADIALNLPASVTVGLGRNGRWDLEMVQGATVLRLLQGKAAIVAEVTQ